MNANGKPDRQGGPEPADLRSTLQAWTVAGAPPDVEARLRSTFRRRRAAHRRNLWLAAAAVLAVVAIPLWHVADSILLDRVSRPPGSTTPPAPVGGSPSAEPTNAVAQLAITSGGKSTHSRLAGGRLTLTARRTAAVIVEPGQAELVRQLGQQLSRVRQAPPGVSVPRVEVTAAYAAPPSIPEVSAVAVPQYTTNWEPVTGEWPVTQRSVPTNRR